MQFACSTWLSLAPSISLMFSKRVAVFPACNLIAACGNAQVAYFVNSGSEANDLALRIASCEAPGATHVAIMAGAYHGHTKAIIDLSPYKYDGPGGEGQQPHVHVLPCPDPYRCFISVIRFFTYGGSKTVLSHESSRIKQTTSL